MAHDDQDGGTHDRRSKRSLVLLAAKVRTKSGILDVKLRNLSQKGALLEAQSSPSVDSELVFERGDTVAKARVAWASGNRFGIEFLEPIQESEVLVHVGRAKPDSTVHGSSSTFRRTGLRNASLKTGERKLASGWARPRGSGRTLGE